MRGRSRQSPRRAWGVVAAAFLLAPSPAQAGLVWTKTLGDVADASIATGRIWVGAGTRVIAFDLATGKAVAAVEAGGEVSSVAADAGSVVALVEGVGALVLDSRTGEKRYLARAHEGYAGGAPGGNLILLTRKNGVVEALGLKGALVKVIAPVPAAAKPAAEDIDEAKPAGETPASEPAPGLVQFPDEGAAEGSGSEAASGSGAAQASAASGSAAAGSSAATPATLPAAAQTELVGPKPYWTASLTSRPVGAPVITATHVYAADDTFVHALERRSGRRSWRFALRSPATPLAFGASVIVSGVRPRFCTALEPALGRFRWSYRLPSRASLPPVLGGERLFVVAPLPGTGSNDERKRRSLLRALDPKTGAARWALALPGEVSALAATEHVVVAAVGKTLVLVGAERGLILGAIDLEAPVRRLYADGGIVVTVGDKGVLAAHPIPEAAPTAFPVDATLAQLAPGGPARADLELLATRFATREVEATGGEAAGRAAVLVVSRRVANDLLLGRPVLSLELLAADSYLLRVKLAVDTQDVLSFDNDRAAARSEYVEVTRAQAEFLTRDKLPLPEGASLAESRVEVDSDGKAYLEVRWKADGAPKPEMEMRLHPRTGALISMVALWKNALPVVDKWRTALLAATAPQPRGKDAPAAEGPPEEPRNLLAGELRHHKLASQAYDVTFDGVWLWVTTNGGLYRVKPETGESTRFTTKDGLLDNEVTAISARKGSEVWVASARGLTRIFGKEVRRYSFELPELRGREVLVRQIAQGKGKVWVATSAGVIRFRDGEFTWFGRPHGILSENVRAVSVAPNGDAWVATEEGVARFDGKTWSMLRDTDGLLQNDAVGLIVDKKGRIWVATQESGVSRWDGRSWRSFKQVTGYGLDDEKGPPSNRLLDFAMDTPGNIWAVHENGLSRYSQGAWWHFPLEGATTGRRLSRVVLAGRRMVCVARGAGQGLVAFNGRAWVPDFVPPDRTEPPSVDWVVASGDAIYAGARGFGVARYASAKWERQNIDEGEFSAVLRSTESAVADGAGGVWVGIRGGVCRHHKGLWRCQNKGFAAAPVVSLSVGPKGELWTAQKGGGLRRLEGGQWSDFGLTDGVGTLDVREVSVAQDGTVFALVSPAPGRTNVLRMPPGAPRFEKQEVAGEPTTLARDREGAVWVGTTAGGLLRWKDGRFVVEQGFGPLRGSPVVRLAFDAAGKPWVIQEREPGARRYNGKGWSHFTRESGLSSSRARDVAVDSRGAAWVGTDEGLTEYLPKDEP